jgi:hypothetical protein
VGATHPVKVILTLDSGEEISIWGGTQGFQTILQRNEQYTIIGKDLDRYFENLVTRITRPKEKN